MSHSFQIKITNKNVYIVALDYLMGLGFTWGCHKNAKTIFEAYPLLHLKYSYLTIFSEDKRLDSHVFSNNQFEQVDFNFLFSEDFKKYWEPPFITVQSNKNKDILFEVWPNKIVLVTGLKEENIRDQKRFDIMDLELIDKLAEARFKLTSGWSGKKETR